MLPFGSVECLVGSERVFPFLGIFHVNHLAW